MRIHPLNKLVVWVIMPENNINFISQFILNLFEDD